MPGLPRAAACRPSSCSTATGVGPTCAGRSGAVGRGRVRRPPACWRPDTPWWTSTSAAPGRRSAPGPTSGRPRRPPTRPPCWTGSSRGRGRTAAWPPSASPTAERRRFSSPRAATRRSVPSPPGSASGTWPTTSCSRAASATPGWPSGGRSGSPRSTGAGSRSEGRAPAWLCAGRAPWRGAGATCARRSPSTARTARRARPRRHRRAAPGAGAQLGTRRDPRVGNRRALAGRVVRRSGDPGGGRDPSRARRRARPRPVGSRRLPRRQPAPRLGRDALRHRRRGARLPRPRVRDARRRGGGARALPRRRRGAMANRRRPGRRRGRPAWRSASTRSVPSPRLLRPPAPTTTSSTSRPPRASARGGRSQLQPAPPTSYAGRAPLACSYTSAPFPDGLEIAGEPVCLLMLEAGAEPCQPVLLPRRDRAGRVGDVRHRGLLGGRRPVALDGSGRAPADRLPDRTREARFACPSPRSTATCSTLRRPAVRGSACIAAGRSRAASSCPWCHAADLLKVASRMPMFR